MSKLTYTLLELRLLTAWQRLPSIPPPDKSTHGRFPSSGDHHPNNE